MRFAAYIPLGPGLAEFERALDLVEALVLYEPLVSYVVIADDGGHVGQLEEQLSLPPSCQLIVVPHPAGAGDVNYLGRICTANLAALNYINNYCNVDFVVKLDTDSLVIAPFSAKIETKFSSCKDYGLLGVLGTSCNPAIRSFKYDMIVANGIASALEIAQRLGRLSAADRQILSELGIVTCHQLDAFGRACNLIRPVLKTSFTGKHCQGGAYAISGLMVHRMGNAGFFDDPMIWLQMPIAEDQMMGTICAVVGMDAVDFGRPNEPFGIQAVGLPYPPEVLLEYGYSVVHSIKDSPRISEKSIRQIFRQARRPQGATLSASIETT